MGDLDSRQSYTFNVRASTTVGIGPVGTTVTAKPMELAPAAIVQFSQEIVSLNSFWEILELFREKMEFWIIKILFRKCVKL